MKNNNMNFNEEQSLLDKTPYFIDGAQHKLNLLKAHSGYEYYLDLVVEDPNEKVIKLKLDEYLNVPIEVIEQLNDGNVGVTFDKLSSLLTLDISKVVPNFMSSKEFRVIKIAINTFSKDIIEGETKSIHYQNVNNQLNEILNLNFSSKQRLETYSVPNEADTTSTVGEQKQKPTNINLVNGGFEYPALSDDDWNNLPALKNNLGLVNIPWSSNPTPTSQIYKVYITYDSPVFGRERIGWRPLVLQHGVDPTELRAKSIEFMKNRSLVSGESAYAGRLIPSPQGRQFVELNASYFTKLYQTVLTTPGIKTRWSLSHTGQKAGMGNGDTLGVQFGPTPEVKDSNYDQKYYTDDLEWSHGKEANWKEHKGSYVIPNGQTSTTFGFYAAKTWNNNQVNGNYLDDIKFTNPSFITLDKTVNGMKVATGRPSNLFTYKLTAKNQGEMAATDIWITDEIPNYLEVDEKTLPAGATYNRNTRLVTMPKILKIDIGKSVTFSFKVRLTHQDRYENSKGYLRIDNGAKIVYKDLNFVDMIYENYSNIVTIIPEMVGKIKIIKKNDLGELKAGAKYQIRDAKGTIVVSNAVAITGSDGTYVSADLPIGDYTVTETKAPDGHDLPKPASTATKKVTIKNNQIVPVEFKNDRQGRIVIKKIDKETKAVLAGAEFRVLNSAGQEVGTRLKTGSTGQVTSGYLTAGSYTIEETAAPVNYDLSSPKSQKVTLKVGETTQPVVFENTRQKGGLQIIKQDDTKKRLANAKYIVKNASGSQVGSGQTNAEGVYTLTNLPTGKYTVTESAAPAGHVSSPVEGNNRMIEVVKGQTATMTFTNTRQGRIVIKKIDKETKAVLAGAEFRVLNSAGQEVGTRLKTGSTGQVTSGYLTAGSYTIEETAAPVNYDLSSPKSQKVTLKVGETTQPVVFENTRQKGGLQIIKQDDTKKRLANAKYIVKNASGSQVGSGQTNAEGVYTLTNLPTGKYTVTESAAPAGHVSIPVEGNNRTIEVVKGQTATMTFTNTRQGRIVIKKIDKETKAVLAGAEFRVLNSAGQEVGTRLKTGSTGQVTSGYLTAGSYTIEETAAPVNYDLSSPKSQKVTLKVGETTQPVVFENTRQKGGLQIIKQDDTKKRLANAKYIVKNASGSQVGSGQTNAEGVYTLTNLPTGKYTVTESAAPAGHVSSPVEGNNRTIEVVKGQTATMTFTNTRQGRIVIKKIDKESKAVLAGAEFRVLNSAGQEVGTRLKTGSTGQVTSGYLTAGSYTIEETAAPVNYDLSSPKSQKVTLKVGETTQPVVFENTRQKGGLQIIKQDDTKKRLANAKYIVKNASGSQVGSGQTNAEGVYTLTNLPTGKYTVTESAAPAGHVSIPVEGNNRTIEVVKGQTATMTFTNTRQGRIVIKKIDKESKAVLAGAEYRVTNSTGQEVVKSIKTGSNGTVTTGYLPAGDYRIHEISAPTNYDLANPASKVVTLKVGETTQPVVFENARHKGGLEIVKVNEENKNQKLEGAIFDIASDEKGTNILYKNQKTDASGKIIIPTLKTGTYYVKETTPPPGYQIIKNTWVSVNIIHGKVTSYQVENRPTRLHLRQVVLKPHDALVVPSLGYFTLNQVKSSGSIINAYQLVTNSTVKDKPTEISKELFKTVQIPIGVDKLQVVDVIPEYYSYHGAITTTDDTNLENKHSSTNTTEMIKTEPVTVDYNKSSEYWITIFISPKMGKASTGEEEKEPRPYSWDYKTNELGRLKQIE
ncbi:SpaA isopeptide-forming pilin-related protein [Candidatus Enterococcus mansonii]|uniref:SpaA isopeptide-forming pilin-related protein n=1 Tax=Candidatus Enterococcus mansonii TaxID=1834181 RepID=UPI003015034B